MKNHQQRRKFRKLIRFTAGFLITSTLIIPDIFGQIQWSKYHNNPVVKKGPANWDIIAIGQPTVLIQNDTIKMWYAGVGADMKGRICYAYTVDGINWTKHPNPVIDVGSKGEWDCGWMDTPEIVYDGTSYKMYYYGDTVQQFAAISSAIGVAFSPDGIHWTKHPGNPVFLKGKAGDWDRTWVESPAILWDSINGKFLMWYNGVDTSTWRIPIGLATSPDGINWTRHAGNPVLANGNWGQYDDMWLGTPAVINSSGLYEMWYASTCTKSYNYILQKFDTVNICYASSADGINWIKHPTNPLFHTYTLPYDSIKDAGGPWAPDVIFNKKKNEYWMWFETFDGFMFASSPKIPLNLKHDDFGDNKLSVSPNPFSMFTTIQSAENLNNAVLQVYNSTGLIVKEYDHISGNSFTFQRSDLPVGMYILKLTKNKEVLSAKIMIK